MAYSNLRFTKLKPEVRKRESNNNIVSSIRKFLKNVINTSYYRQTNRKRAESECKSACSILYPFMYLSMILLILSNDVLMLMSTVNEIPIYVASIQGFAVYGPLSLCHLPFAIYYLLFAICHSCRAASHISNIIIIFIFILILSLQSKTVSISSKLTNARTFVSSTTNYQLPTTNKQQPTKWHLFASVRWQFLIIFFSYGL